MKFNCDYSEYSDILSVHRDGSITKGSVEVGDFTLDFDKNDEIVGIEIEYASEFLSNLDIDKESLTKIQKALITIDKRNPNCQIIFLKLEFLEMTMNIPLPMPVVSSSR